MISVLISNSQIPQWARASANRLQQAAERVEAGKSLQDPSISATSLDAEDVTTRLWRQRDQFIRVRNQDEDDRYDSALDQPGRVVNNQGTEFNFEGGFLKGELTINTGDDNVYQSMTSNGSTSTGLFVSRDGYATISHYDMAHPDRSYRLSTGESGPLDIPASPYESAVISAADTLEALPKGSEARLMTSVFMEGSASMPQARQDFQDELKAGLEALKADNIDVAKLQQLLKRPNGRTPHQLSSELLALSKAHPENKAVKALRETSGFWQVMEDFPKLSADGVTRSMEFYVSPGHLQTATMAQGWDVDKSSGLPIADSIIVGAGPGGLASGYHLSEQGKRTVIFEGGHAGQGFSDANAMPVHQLRTNGDTSSLIYVGGPAHLGVDVSMPRHLTKNRAKCDGAREKWEEATGQDIQGVSKAGPSDRRNPANRAELFSHMSQVAMGLSQHYPDTFVCEKSPVTNIEKVERGEDTLFRVTTDKGHQMMTRSLVMATGFVGGHGEHARCLTQFKALEEKHPTATVLANDHDLVGKNSALVEAEAALDQGQLNRNFVISDRLIGRPEMRSYVAKMPEGSKVAVIGGGESATKGALEILSLNPGISLDLYTSNPMEPYQTQIPIKVILPPVVEKSIEEPRIAKRTLDELENFRTPVTPETLEKLLEFESAGRVRIHEMGRYFSEKTTEVTPVMTEHGQSLQVTLIDETARENLIAQRQSWSEAGIYADRAPEFPADQLPNADLVMVAAGYDRRSLRAGPLLQQLIDQDLVELDGGEPRVGPDGLTSAKNGMVAFNTAGAMNQAADSAIPARAIRAFRLAQLFEDRLPEREKPTDRIASKLPYGNVDTRTDRDNFRWDTKRVETLINNGGFTDKAIADKEATIASLTDPEEKRLYQAWWTAERKFPLVNSPVRALVARANEVPEALTPVEKLMAERAQTVATRIAPDL